MKRSAAKDGRRRWRLADAAWALLLAGAAAALVPAACVLEGAPDYPATLTAEGGDHKVLLKWASVDGADSYNLYWANSAGVETGADAKLADVTSPYTHTGLTNGSTYYYVATAENSNGESSHSIEVSATPLPPRPGAPTGVAAVAGNGRNTLSWESVKRATSYSLFWSVKSMVGKATGKRIKSVTSPHTHSGLTNGTRYYYVVTASNLAGESGDSQKVSGTPLGFDTLVDTLDAADNAEPEAHFGERAALLGDLAFVTAPRADTALLADTGEVHLFESDAGTWSESQVLAASDGAALDRFGGSVAVSGDTVLIGAPDAQPGAALGAGAVYAFDRDTTTGVWSEAQKLSASDGAAGDAFGHAVAIDGEVALVGAPYAAQGADDDAGAVYVFVRDAATGDWGEAQKLAPSVAGNGAFGRAVALLGDRAVVGAPNSDPDLGSGALPAAGVVYVFDRDPDTDIWSETVVLTRAESEAAAGDGLGEMVATNGLFLAAAAPYADVDPGSGALLDSGAVYLFILDEDTAGWSQKVKLVSDAPEAGDLFGSALALEENILLVGAPHAADTAGAAFAFYRNSANGVWSTTPVVIAPGTLAAGDGFGQWAALSDGLGMVGAPGADPDLGAGALTDAGLIYLYK